MQLYVIEWSFQSGEDQLFATNEFCNYFKDGKINEFIEGFEMKFMAHIPQSGTGVIICRATNSSVLFSIFNMWRDSFNISFNFFPALTNEELLSSLNGKSYWSKD